MIKEKRLLTQIFKNKAFNNVGIYTFGAILQKGIAFFLLPLYISLLKPADYGAIEFASTLNTVLSIFLSLGLLQVIYTEYFRVHDKERPNIIYQSILIYTIWGCPLFILLLIVLLLFGKQITNIDYSSTAILLFLLTGFGAFYQSVFTSILKLSGKAVFHTIFSISIGLVSILLNLIFLLYLKIGIIGVFLSNFIAMIITMIIAFRFFLQKKIFNFKYDKLEIKRLLKIGFPFMLTNAAYLLMSGADRFIVVKFLGTNSLGVYSLASKFAFILQPLLIFPLLDAIMPTLYKRFASQNHNLYLKYVILGTILIFSIIGIILRFFANYIVKGDYLEALPLLFVFVFGTAFYFITSYIGSVLSFHQKSKLLLINVLIAGSFNIILNITLIQHMGVKGAAYAYFAGNLIWAILTWMQTRHFIKKMTLYVNNND